MEKEINKWKRKAKWRKREKQILERVTTNWRKKERKTNLRKKERKKDKFEKERDFLLKRLHQVVELQLFCGFGQSTFQDGKNQEGRGRGD